MHRNITEHLTFRKPRRKTQHLLDLLTFVKTQEEKVLIFKLFDQNLISQNQRFKELLPKISQSNIRMIKISLRSWPNTALAEQKPRLTQDHDELKRQACYRACGKYPYPTFWNKSHQRCIE